MFILYFIVQINVIVVYGILGGRDVKITEAPYQVSYVDICGAVLIRNKWALTTAHCGPEGTYIRIGSRHRFKGPKAQILSHFIHPKYQLRHEFDYDVQLLKLLRGLHLGPQVGVVSICEGDCGRELKVFVWGYAKERGEYNNILQGIEIEVVAKEECQKVNQSWYNHSLTSRMFCAGGLGKDACQGDSGGAAVSSGQLAGLSSFGYGCGRDLPGVYTNLSHYGIRVWIDGHMDFY